jgi:hypothetical protein
MRGSALSIFDLTDLLGIDIVGISLFRNYARTAIGDSNGNTPDPQAGFAKLTVSASLNGPQLIVG